MVSGTQQNKSLNYDNVGVLIQKTNEHTSQAPLNLPAPSLIFNRPSTAKVISLLSLTPPQKKVSTWQSSNQLSFDNKQILRQSVVLNQPTNACFLTNTTATTGRPNADPIHVVLKKSSNQTIVIVSKPQTSASISSQHTSLSSSNKIDNSLISQVGLTTPSVQVELKPQQNGIELLAAAAAAQSNQSAEKEHKADKVNRETTVGSGDVTRCICEMEHDDGFMICCDKCL